MELFYSENLLLRDTQVFLSEEEGHHLRKVLRKKQGDSIQITNGKGALADAVVAGEKSQMVVCDVHSIQHVTPPPERNIHVALSAIRPNRQDWAVEKLTELGVGSISFFHSQFTSVRAFKADHLRKIAISAMKQSQQCYLPQISAPVPFSKWIKLLSNDNDQVRLLAHLNNSSESLSQIGRGKQAVVVAIGPEGGFSEGELRLAVENGFTLVRINNHILRTETAAVIGAAQIKMSIG
jgi:16S rRNA (uracil1498-N3)-methyltransferase